MSRPNLKRSRQQQGDESDGSDEVQLYTRADASLWDDSALVKLWNDQLGKASTQDSNGSGDAESGSVNSTETQSRDESDDDRSDGDEAVEPAVRTARKPAAKAAALSLEHLPKDVQRLAQSFFDAGFEAGYYAAKTEKRA